MIMTDVTTLPGDFTDKLLAGIAQSRATTPMGAGGGKDLLRLIKRGVWVFGQGNEEVQEGSRWAINIYSLQHGYNCWNKDPKRTKNELLGEIMVPMTQPKPACPEPINGNAFTPQWGCEMKCLDGDDKDREVLYKTNSVGGKRAFDDLLAKIQAHVPTDREHPCPVVTLSSESYPHPIHGETWNPILTIVSWVSVQGVAPARAAVAPPAEAEPAKPRKAPLAAAAEPAEPVATARTHVGQRRRPTAA